MRNNSMKVKNMVFEHQSSYVAQFTHKKDKITQGLIIGAVSFLIAFLASKLSGITFLCFLLSLVSLILSGGEVISRILKTLKKGKVDDNALIVIAILIPFVLGRFVISAFSMALYKLMYVLLMYVSNGLANQLKKTEIVTPTYANLVVDGDIRVVESATLTQDAKIIVKNGETVPVDCVIEDGFSEFDVSSVYLADSSVSLSVGDKILAGFVNLGSSITCRAVCNYEESLVMDLDRLSSMAEKGTSKGDKQFLSIAKWYPAAIFAVSILVLLIAGFAKGAWVDAMLRVSVLLIVATTGSYVLAAPLLRACAVWNLKKKGLAISTGDLIEEIADINCLAFEKNGILTDGVYKMKDIYTAEGISEEDFLMIAGNCIGSFSHPISKLVAKYKNEHIPVENMIEFPGKGLECTIMGKSFLCGAEGFMKECSVDVSEVLGHTIYIAIDGLLMGAMTAQDTVKPATGDMLRKLRQQGVEKIVMFSSEQKEVAELAAGDCGADTYMANLTAATRETAVLELKAAEDVTVAYVGDAMVGAQAIDAADVGVTLIGKEYSSVECAKATLLGELTTVAEAIEIARLTSGKTELHFYCATAVKLILALLGLFGAINISAAIVAEALLTLVSLFSAKDLLKK